MPEQKLYIMTAKKRLMEPWVIYGLVAALAFGTNVIIYRLGFSSNTNPFYASILFGLGIMITFLIAFLTLNRDTTISLQGAGLIIFSGAIWAIGSIAVAIAFSQNYDVSKMSILYSSAFIITVALSILVFNELRTKVELIRVLIRMALVLAGLIVVSVK